MPQDQGPQPPPAWETRGRDKARKSMSSDSLLLMAGRYSREPGGRHGATLMALYHWCPFSSNRIGPPRFVALFRWISPDADAFCSAQRRYTKPRMTENDVCDKSAKNVANSFILMCFLLGNVSFKAVHPKLLWGDELVLTQHLQEVCDNPLSQKP